METNQNSGVDFSGFSNLPKSTNNNKVVVPPDFDRQERKNKVQLIIIAVCVSLGIVFWGMYFARNAAKTAPAEGIPAEEMIPE